MKWSEFYDGLSIKSDKDQPGYGSGDQSLIERLANGERLNLQPFHYSDLETLYCPTDVSVIVERIEMSPQLAIARLRFRTEGAILPDGFKHGTYSLNFESGDCENLPKEMFEQGDADEHDLDDWESSKQRATK